MTGAADNCDRFVIIFFFYFIYFLFLRPLLLLPRTHDHRFCLGFSNNYNLYSHSRPGPRVSFRPRLSPLSTPSLFLSTDSQNVIRTPTYLIDISLEILFTIMSAGRFFILTLYCRYRLVTSRASATIFSGDQFINSNNIVISRRYTICVQDTHAPSRQHNTIRVLYLCNNIIMITYTGVMVYISIVFCVKADLSSKRSTP